MSKLDSFLNHIAQLKGSRKNLKNLAGIFQQPMVAMDSADLLAHSVSNRFDSLTFGNGQYCSITKPHLRMQDILRECDGCAVVQGAQME